MRTLSAPKAVVATALAIVRAVFASATATLVVALPSGAFADTQLEAIALSAWLEGANAKNVAVKKTRANEVLVFMRPNVRANPDRGGGTACPRGAA
jgi:hypothetical protein